MIDKWHYKIHPNNYLSINIFIAFCTLIIHYI